jgi:hypothetical protein
MSNNYYLTIVFWSIFLKLFYFFGQSYKEF